MDIIDADGHIVEKETDMRVYVPEPHCNAVARFCRPRQFDGEPFGAGSMTMTSNETTQLPIAAPITTLSPMSVKPIGD
jgi:hypothetical protein